MGPKYSRQNIVAAGRNRENGRDTGFRAARSDVNRTAGRSATARQLSTVVGLRASTTSRASAAPCGAIPTHSPTMATRVKQSRKIRNTETK
jgi:hypothetical protein